MKILCTLDIQAIKSH